MTSAIGCILESLRGQLRHLMTSTAKVCKEGFINRKQKRIGVQIVEPISIGRYLVAYKPNMNDCPHSQKQSHNLEFVWTYVQPAEKDHSEHHGSMARDIHEFFSRT